MTIQYSPYDMVGPWAIELFTSFRLSPLPDSAPKRRHDNVEEQCRITPADCIQIAPLDDET